MSKGVLNKDTTLKAGPRTLALLCLGTAHWVSPPGFPEDRSLVAEPGSDILAGFLGSRTWDREEFVEGSGGDAASGSMGGEAGQKAWLRLLLVPGSRSLGAGLALLTCGSRAQGKCKSLVPRADTKIHIFSFLRSSLKLSWWFLFSVLSEGKKNEMFNRQHEFSHIMHCQF